LSGEAAGLLVIGATAMPGVSADVVEKALDTELRRIASSGVEEREAERARTVTIARLIRELETLDDRAERLADFATFFGDASRINSEADRYEAVSLRDLGEQAARLLSATDRVVLTFLPEGDGEGGSA